MKTFLIKFLIILAGLFYFTSASIAQVKFKSGVFNPSHNIANANFSKAGIDISLFDKKYFIIVSFDKIPDKEIQRQLQSEGIHLIQYLPSNSYMAVVDDKFDFSVSYKFGINSVDVLPADKKIDPSVTSEKVIDASSAIAVFYSSQVDRKKAEETFKNNGATILHTKLDKDGVAFIKISTEKIYDIAALPFVINISKQIIKPVALNYNNNAAHGNDAVSYSGIGGRALTGKGVTVGVGDDGNVTSHIDFSGRVIDRNGAPFSYHGTHTTGTAAGAGIIDQKNKGMSPLATIVSQYFSDIIVDAPLYFFDNNLTITSNSYYSANPGCIGESQYDVLSNYADAQTKSYDNILHVIAAGNDGALTCSVYPLAFGTIKSGWQVAKNVLTVGAIDNSTNNVATFSSRGPVQDGRLKPEIVAGGVAIISTIPNNLYGSDAGTSMASPTVAGSLSLLTQRYKQLNSNQNPKGFLLKALICNSAQDLGNKGPDYTYGFGKLNTRLAVQDLEANQYFIDSVTNGQMNQHNITIPAGAKQLKVLLYWPDEEASPNAATALVNDLDITVTDPLSGSHLPLILNSNPASVNLPATQGADHINNIEQVVVDNPPAGNYTININGYAIPLGSQPYAVAYEIVNPSVFVEYPFGGETLVPGDNETVRWSADDSDINSFNVEYSIDNGATWQTINNNVNAIQRSCVWAIPAMVTNTAMVMVTRNTTAITAKSSFNFAILGRPVITPTIPCDGYIQIDWPAIASATAYDIFILDGDSMKTIATTNTNTYLISGLDTKKNYWVAVAAKNGVITGRRSIAKNITPSSGACTLSAFDNDLKAVSILSPTTGRQFTSTASLPTQPITVQIKNLDDSPSTGSFNVSYSINGSLPVTETISPTIGAGSIYNHTFAQQAINASPFIDTIKVWVTKSSDLQHENDTAYKIVKLLSNPVTALPFNEGFETATDSAYTSNTTGFNGLDDIDFSTNTSSGRARTFVNTGFALSGNRAITLDQAPYSVVSTSDSLMLTNNLSSYSTSSNLLRLDFFYKNNGADNLPGNKVWIRGSDTSAWLPAYDLYANQGAAGDYTNAKGININEIFSAASPQQNVSSSFQIKFGQQGYTSSNSVYPDPSIDDGYTFDNVKISEALNDVSVTQILSPTNADCGLTSATTIIIRVKNYSNAILNNVQVSYRINNNTPVTETIASLNANQQLDYAFTTTADMSAFIDYNIDAWVTYSQDTYPNNDSVLNYTLHNSPLISSFPYLEGFETSNGNWYTKGINSSWQWGTPAKTIINKAANGTKAWVTNLTGNYNDNELSYLYSPCFNLSSLAEPVLSFSHIFKLEDACNCDFHWVEYSTDAGTTWNKLGAKDSGTNWYDNATYQKWQQAKTKWEVASIDIPTNASSVRFRFVMNSDEAANYDGVGIDDIHVFDKASVYTGADAVIAPQLVNGNNWVDFKIGNTIVASINPKGQDLGLTSVNVYFNNGPVRTSNNQYYLDRNIVIHPTIQPIDSVTVRFYFTDSEAIHLMNATGCGTCTTIYDAYDAGVTKFSGNMSEENGTLSDDTTGFYQFIPPANVDIIPNDNGYYAEYTVNSFSEFWIDSGGLSGVSPLPITLLNFTAIKNNEAASLAWSTSQESNSRQFVIERSADGINFLPIGTVVAKGNSNTETDYQFTDALTLSGNNYYRIKMIDNSGHFNYSVIRQLNFNKSGGEVKVFPNPVVNGKITINTSENCKQIELLNVAGQKIKIFTTSGYSNNIQVGKLPKGVYQLKIFTTANTVTVKINIE